jgi:hypothetical protein
MRLAVKVSILLLMLCSFAPLAKATTAGDLVASCEKSLTATNAKGQYAQKRPDDIYKAGQCSGFIEGWLEGLDGSILTGPSGSGVRLVAVTIKWNEIPGAWKIAAALQKDLQDTPLDSGKSADEILRKILLANGLIEQKPYVVPVGVTDTSQ